MLDEDVDQAVADCASFPWFHTLDAIRQRVIVDMRFNLGPTKFRRFKQTLAAVASGDYVKASEQMLKSEWADQVKTRAQRLARMMATGLALVLLSASTLWAQPSPEDIVQRQRDHYGEMVSPQEAPVLLKAIAVDLTESLGVRYGLLPKTTGNHCGGYACDIICTASEHWDVLGSGPSGDVNQPGPSTAQWLPKGAVPRACELVDVASSPDSSSIQPTEPARDTEALAALSSAVDTLSTRIAEVEAQLASVLHDVTSVRDELETRSESMASAIVTLAARPTITTCHASAFWIPIHCEVK